MTRIKKYGEETVLYAKRIPKSKQEDVTLMVEKFLKDFEILPAKKCIQKIHRNGIKNRRI